MTLTDLKPRTQQITIEEVLPHAPELVWKALTTGAFISRWMMDPIGFAPEKGKHFSFRTTPAGAWDGLIRCQVLEIIPNEYFAYSWRGGDADNVGYGSLLDTVVSFTLTPVAGGTRLKLMHSGFEMPRNETAFANLGGGWAHCVERLDAVINSPDDA